jgi:hypothetical protein
MTVSIFLIAISLGFQAPLDLSISEGSSTTVCATLTGGTIARSIPVIFSVEDISTTGRSKIEHMIKCMCMCSAGVLHQPAALCG